MVEQKAVSEGIVQLHQGLTLLRTIGTEQSLPHWGAVLGGAYKRAGQVEEGLRVLDEALTAIHKSAECYYEAEMCRLKGELLFVQARPRKGEFAKGPRGIHQRWLRLGRCGCPLPCPYKRK